MELVRGRASTLQPLWRVLGIDEPFPEGTAADEAAYRARQEQTGYGAWTAVFLGVALMAVLWWPTDYLIFRGQRRVIHAFAIARGSSSVLTLVCLFIISRWPFLRRNALPSMTVLACVNLVIWGFEFGELGGPSALWFNFLPQLIACTFIITLAWRSRIVVCTSFALAMVAGYFGMHPGYFSDSLAPAVLDCVVCSVLASVGIGMLMDYLRRQAFFLRLDSQRQAEALTAMNSQLESRVRDQTAELRGLTHRLETTRENERTHIARELHDELGQELTALRLALKYARLRYERDINIYGNLVELENLLARTTATTRNILVDLRPRVLDDLGLAAAMDWLVTRTRQRTGIECRLEMLTEPTQLSDVVATAAFRILQEALTNVTRHAQAKKAQVTLRSHDEAIEIIVQDDGVGFDGSKRDRLTGGLGLVGMRERARAVGGEMELESAPGSGTRVHVTLPKHAQRLQESA